MDISDCLEIDWRYHTKGSSYNLIELPKAEYFDTNELHHLFVDRVKQKQAKNIVDCAGCYSRQNGLHGFCNFKQKHNREKTKRNEYLEIAIPTCLSCDSFYLEESIPILFLRFVCGTKCMSNTVLMQEHLTWVNHLLEELVCKVRFN